MTLEAFPAFGLHHRSHTDAVDLAERLSAAGWAVFKLPEPIRSKGEFIDGVASTLPVDPPLSREPGNWDALNDSLGNGLLGMDADHIAILWPNHQVLWRSDREAHRLANEILGGLTWTLADPAMTGGRPQNLLVILIDPPRRPLR